MNTKLIVVVVLILAIFLLYKNTENMAGTPVAGTPAKPASDNTGTPVAGTPAKPLPMARYIRIDGGQNFAMTEVEVIDVRGRNILRPFHFDISNNSNFENISEYDYMRLEDMHYDRVKNIKKPSRHDISYTNIDSKQINIKLLLGGYHEYSSGLETLIDGIKYTNNKNYYYHAHQLYYFCIILIDLGKEYAIDKVNIYQRYNNDPPIVNRYNNTTVSLLNEDHDRVNWYTHQKHTYVENIELAKSKDTHNLECNLKNRTDRNYHPPKPIEFTFSPKNYITASQIIIEGGQLLPIAELAVIDTSGNNILKPLIFNDTEKKAKYDNINKNPKTDFKTKATYLGYDPKTPHNYSYKNIYDQNINIELKEGGIYKYDYTKLKNNTPSHGDHGGLYNLIDGSKYESDDWKIFSGNDKSSKHTIHINLGKEYQIQELNIYPRIHYRNKGYLNNTKITFKNNRGETVNKNNSNEPVETKDTGNFKYVDYINFPDNRKEIIPITFTF
jgi:hypothetical protein